jgi:hypothetical protein
MPQQLMGAVRTLMKAKYCFLHAICRMQALHSIALCNFLWQTQVDEQLSNACVAVLLPKQVPMDPSKGSDCQVPALVAAAVVQQPTDEAAAAAACLAIFRSRCQRCYACWGSG